MKKLIFMRHGKSSWNYAVSDRERPLKKRGENDAKLVANAFKEKNITLDALYSSPANRALSTAHIFADELGINTQDISIEEQLYDFAGYMVKEFINNIPNRYSTVIIFGHNYAFTSLVNKFGNQSIENLPTSGLAMINFDSDNWKDIKLGTTEAIIIPKPLRA